MPPPPPPHLLLSQPLSAACLSHSQIDEATRFQGQILKVSGPLCVGEKMSGAFMHELVRVGQKRIGE